MSKAPIEVRYCEDCRFFSMNGLSPRCAHPLCSPANLIQRSVGRADCSTERGYCGPSTTCGPQARYFEPVQIGEIKEGPVAAVREDPSPPRLSRWLHLLPKIRVKSI